MIENYVHWNEDIGEWQLVSIPSYVVTLHRGECAGCCGRRRVQDRADGAQCTG
jgi:hypothetical protein